MQAPRRYTSPSSRGLGHRPFTAVTGVRIPLGTPITLIVYRELVSCSSQISHKDAYDSPRRWRTRDGISPAARFPRPGPATAVGSEKRPLLQPPVTAQTRRKGSFGWPPGTSRSNSLSKMGGLCGKNRNCRQPQPQYLDCASLIPCRLHVPEVMIPPLGTTLNPGDCIRVVVPVATR